MIKNANEYLWGKQIPFLEESYRSNLRTTRSKPSLLGIVRDFHRPNTLKKNFKYQWEDVPIPKYSKGPLRSVCNSQNDGYRWGCLQEKDTIHQRQEKLNIENSEEQWSKSDSSIELISSSPLFSTKNNISNEDCTINERERKEVLSWMGVLSKKGEPIKPPIVVVMKKKDSDNESRGNHGKISHKLSKTCDFAENYIHSGTSLICVRSAKEKKIKPSKSLDSELMVKRKTEHIDKGSHIFQNKNTIRESSARRSGTRGREVHNVDDPRTTQRIYNRPQVFTAKSRHIFDKRSPTYCMPKLFCRPVVDDSNIYHRKSKTNVGLYVNKNETSRRSNHAFVSNDPKRLKVNKSTCDLRERSINKANIESMRTTTLGWYKPSNNFNTLSSSDDYYRDSSSGTEMAFARFNISARNRRKHSNMSFEKQSSYSELNCVSRNNTKKRLNSFCIAQMQQYKHPPHYFKKGCLLGHIGKKFPFGRNPTSGKIRILKSNLNTSKDMKHSPSYNISPFLTEDRKGEFKHSFVRTPYTKSHAHFVLMQDQLCDTTEDIKDLDSTDILTAVSSLDLRDQQRSVDIKLNRKKKYNTERRQIKKDIFSKSSSKQNCSPVNKGIKYKKSINLNKIGNVESRTPKMSGTFRTHLHCKEKPELELLDTHTRDSEKNNERNEILKHLNHEMERVTSADTTVSTCTQIASGSIVSQEGNSIALSSDESVESCRSTKMRNRHCGRGPYTSHSFSIPCVNVSTKSQSDVISSSSDCTIRRTGNEPREICNETCAQNAMYKTITYSDEDDEFVHRENDVYATERNRTFQSNQGMTITIKSNKLSKSSSPRAVATQAAIFPFHKIASTQTKHSNDDDDTKRKIKCSGEKARSRSGKRSTKKRNHGTSTKRKGVNMFPGKGHVGQETNELTQETPEETSTDPVASKLPKASCTTRNDKVFEGSKCRKVKRRRKITSKPLIKKSSRFHCPRNTTHHNETQTHSNPSPPGMASLDKVNIPPIASPSHKSGVTVDKSTHRLASSQLGFNSTPRQSVTFKTLPRTMQRKGQSAREKIRTNILANRIKNNEWPYTESLVSSRSDLKSKFVRSALKADQPQTYASLMAKDFPQVRRHRAYAQNATDGLQNSGNDVSRVCYQNKTLHKRADCVKNATSFAKNESSQISKDSPRKYGFTTRDCPGIENLPTPKDYWKRDISETRRVLCSKGGSQTPKYFPTKT